MGSDTTSMENFNYSFASLESDMNEEENPFGPPPGGTKLNFRPVYTPQDRKFNQPPQNANGHLGPPPGAQGGPPSFRGPPSGAQGPPSGFQPQQQFNPYGAGGPPSNAGGFGGPPQRQFGGPPTNNMPGGGRGGPRHANGPPSQHRVAPAGPPQRSAVARAGSRQLAFRVVHSTSAHTGFPAGNLEALDTAGWQSERFCLFPQEIGLEFAQPNTEVVQLQILSHQHMISSKVQIFMGDGPDFFRANFRNLGFIKFDDNQRSKFKARELKSVFLNTRGQFLKLVLHQCFANRRNVYSQVSIVAINAIGDGVARNQPPPARLQPYPGQPLSAMSPNRAQSVRAASEVGSQFADNQAFDSHTASKLKELRAEKVRALDQENYDMCKRIKYVEGIVKSLGAQLAKLETQKMQAVNSENYDLATQLKQELGYMRADMDAKISRAMAGEDVGPVGPVHDQFNNRGPGPNQGPPPGNQSFPPFGGPAHFQGGGMRGPPDAGQPNFADNRNQPVSHENTFPGNANANQYAQMDFGPDSVPESHPSDRQEKGFPGNSYKQNFGADEYGPDSVPGGGGYGAPNQHQNQGGSPRGSPMAGSPHNLPDQRPQTSTNAIDRIELRTKGAYEIDTDDPFNTGASGPSAQQGSANATGQEIPWGPDHPLFGADGAENLPAPAQLVSDSKGAKETAQVTSHGHVRCCFDFV